MGQKARLAGFNAPRVLLLGRNLLCINILKRVLFFGDALNLTKLHRRI
jgi:hypothetical protein